MPVHDWTKVDDGIFHAAYRGVPGFWRDVLEEKQPTS